MLEPVKQVMANIAKERAPPNLLTNLQSSTSAFSSSGSMLKSVLRRCGAGGAGGAGEQGSLQPSLLVHPSARPTLPACPTCPARSAAPEQ